MFNPNSIPAPIIINTPSPSKVNSVSQPSRLTFGSFGGLPDLELLHEFRLKENEFAQQPPSAISPFRFLPFTEELAPLTDRKTRDLNRMDVIVQKEVNNADVEKWANVIHPSYTG